MLYILVIIADLFNRSFYRLQNKPVFYHRQISVLILLLSAITGQAMYAQTAFTLDTPQSTQLSSSNLKSTQPGFAPGQNNTTPLALSEAFQFAAYFDRNETQVNGIITINIHPDYYLYRHQLRVLHNDQSVPLTEQLPTGKWLDDPTFGHVETYHGILELPLSLPYQDGDTIKVISQGCNAPIGLCYPPAITTITIAPDHLATLTTKELSPQQAEQYALSIDTEAALNTVSEQIVLKSNDSAVNRAALEKLLAETHSTPDQFLALEDAFDFHIGEAAQPPQNLALNATVAEGYYLYRDKLFLAQNTAHPLPEDEPRIMLDLPPGEEKDDRYFGIVQVLRHNFSVLFDASAIDTDKPLNIYYQGCAEGGICYPPSYISFSYRNGLWQQTDITDTGFSIADWLNPRQTGDNFFDHIGLYLGALIAGLLLTFTPCVLPMIPILSAVLTQKSEALTARSGGMTAILYVIGTMITYALMGALAGASGAQLQAYFQNIWAIGLLATIFIICGLAMLGLFNMQLPGRLQTRLTETTARLSGSKVAIIVLGAVSALIVGACVSPILFSFLSIAISAGSATLGAALMATLALGMGIPLIIFGFGNGFLLPRTGAWMVWVTRLFGVLLIIVALYILGTLPQVPILWLWGISFLVFAYLLWRFTHTMKTALKPMFYLLSTALIVWGLLSMVGGYYGERHVMQPLSFLNQNQPSDKAHFVTITNTDELAQQLEIALQNNQFVVLDFYADWCLDCIRMEQTTLTDTQVKAQLTQHFIALKVDITDPYNDATNAIKQQFQIFGPPAMVFLTSEGQPITTASFYGYENAELFLQRLQSITNTPSL